MTKPGAQSKPIAVIGSGCRFPGEANTPSKLWDLLQKPKDLLSKIPSDRFSAAAFYHPDGTHHGATNVQHSYFLSEDPKAFDASFFNLTRLEADCIDPQQRLLMETVYESLSSAGLKVEDLQGSPTAVYVGLMCADYADLLAYDLKSAPTYTATGSSRCIISNRISYFFDWHGPSMTIDTACSSSLVAVHQAVQTLRSGTSKVAIAAGANLIFGPNQYVIESKLNMLSPDGRSRMWDAGANGYARGEGIAAVVLKTLEQALEDGDHIECIIRETGVNQDGRTPGITMPSSTAQEALIRDTYTRAGLDINNPHERCQFFEAHGTGTPAGDPQEASAISAAFFGDRTRAPGEDTLFVGSIKTVIGHTEGTAGLAGLIKASLAVQHGVVPPNMLFEALSPKVAPFYNDVRIIRDAQPWPTLPAGTPRRASVNSFGFGGTNAHAIIENYDACESASVLVPDGLVSPTPLTLSAHSERSLRGTMEALTGFLMRNPQTNIQDLAFTLQKRRSTLPFRRAVPAQTVAAAQAALEKMLEQPQGSLAVKSENKRKPEVLGIFTGQGAQWAAMGKSLIEHSEYTRDLVDELDQALASLPMKDRPSWSLAEELAKEGSASRVREAEFSQPLCAAVQIILVELLNAAGVMFKAVVGHSSGEIGCAFASGCLTATQAIRVAYYRGLLSRRAGGPSGVQGGMMAVGTTLEDAQSLCELEVFTGRITVAACNAPDSITLSGDLDAINQAKEVLDDEAKFARILKVDKAYHSHHMLPCARPYVQALLSCNAGATISSHDMSAAWLSSVHAGKHMKATDATASYWKDNLVSPVMFSQAVEAALEDSGPFDIILEVGPHPALKGPCLSTLQASTGHELPYTGCLERGSNDIDSFGACLGYVWERFGAAGVDFSTFAGLVAPMCPRRIVQDLPTYPFDHDKTYWNESRLLTAYLRREEPAHPLLGTLSANSTASMMQWHNLLRPREISWLDGHQLQGQTVFPGAAYAVMAMEAAKIFAGDRSIQLLEILDLRIGKAVTFDGENDAVEINLTLDIPSASADAGENVELTFSCDSCLAKETHLSWSAGGRLILSFGDDDTLALPSAQDEPPMLTNADVEKFYRELSILGYGYTREFRGLTSIKRSTGCSYGNISVAKFEDNEIPLIIHPATLDLAFQAFIGAFCSPGDDRLWTLHVPISIGRIAVNPVLSLKTQQSFGEVCFHSTISQDDAHAVGGDVDIFLPGTKATLVQVEHIRFKPFSAATEADDRHLFSQWQWGYAMPDAVLEDKAIDRALPEEEAWAKAMERMTYFYIKDLMSNLTEEDRSMALPHHKCFFRWCEHVLTVAASGRHHWYDPSWEHDDHAYIANICQRYSQRADVLMTQRIGQHIIDVIREDISLIDIMSEDGLLYQFYEEALGLRPSYYHLGRLVGQIAHRYPNLEVLEIGAGTGSATVHVLENLANVFNGYTFTDISSGFFDQAKTTFAKYGDQVDFRALDITKDVVQQGFTEHSYEMIVASNVLHATPSLETTMRNCHRLLKPGGYVIFLEITNPDQFHLGFIFGGLSGWWEGVDDGRPLQPFVCVKEWDNILQKTGFGGVESCTVGTDLDTLPLSVFSARAMDPNMIQIEKAIELVTPQPAPEPIVVVGGITPRSARLLEGLEGQLPNRQIQVFPTLENLLGVSFKAKSTFLVLSDLDREFFAHLNEDNFEGLRSMLSSAKNILWLTEDSYEGNPYQSMIMGLFRTLRLEYVDIQQQTLDVDAVTNLDSETLARTLLQLEASNGFKLGERLWTMEPELRLLDGRMMIARLVPDQRRNDRYNSTRRTIENLADPCAKAVGLHKNQGELHLQVESNPTVTTAAKKDYVRISVELSLGHAIRVDSLGYFYLVLGNTIGTKQSVVALCRSNSSIVEIPSLWAMPCKAAMDPAKQILAIGCQLLTRGMLDSVSKGTSIMVHEAPAFLAESLIKRSVERGIFVKFTTTGKCTDDLEGRLVCLHSRATSRSIQAIIPARISAYYDMSNDKAAGGLALRLLDHLPQSCKAFDRSQLLQDESSILCAESEILVSQCLQEAANNATLTDGVVQKIAISEIAKLGPSAVGTSMVVDWTENMDVPTRVRPVDAVDLFDDNKTYLLIGLTGDLGRSICRWMVKHGARYVVLCSRSPKIDPQWQQNMMEDDGATVVVHALNIADKASFLSVMDNIKTTLPPIAGVAHGPLVLQDALFENMDLETMEMVLEAKVKGTIYLDEYFSEDTLDWMVFFSSQVSTGGNRGQSNYAAANMFMNGMAYQRQRRGLAGSTINMGAIYGVGFVAKAAREENYSLNKLMFLPLSEQDLHQQFAEAVIAGRPGSEGSLEVTTGMAWNDPANRDHIPFMDDPRLTWFRLPDKSSKNRAGDSSASGSLKECLAEALTRDQAGLVLRNAMLEKLQTTLQLPPEDFVDVESPLIDQGVDSLVAVSLRTWFSKQLDLDLPVLKVLGGASVTDLAEDALERLPVDALPKISAVEISSPPTVEPTVETGPASAPMEDSERASKSSTPPRADQETGSETSVQPTPMDELTMPLFGDRNLLDVSTPATSVSGEAEEENSDLLASRRSKEIVRKERMSFGQGRFWTMAQLVRDPTTFNVTIGLWIDGPLLIDNLARAVDVFVQRHETFRTRFWQENDTPMQGVMPQSRTRLEYLPCKDKEAALQGFEALQHNLYDLEGGDTCRMVLFGWNPHHHFLVTCYHHIISDGWSFEFMVNELGQLYEGKPLPQQHQYVDFAARQRKEVEEGQMRKEIKYWTDEYKTVPPILPLLPLASASARTTLPWDFHEASLRLPPMVAARIKDRSRKHKASTIHFYLAAYQVLLSRLTGSDDICIGLADANRTGEHDLTTLGFFINLLPMRFAYAGDQTFGEAISQARTKVREALANSRLPFDVLLQKLNIPRTSTHSPLFQAFLDYKQGQSESGKIGAANVSGVEMSRGRTAYDISLEVTEDPTKDPLINLKLQKGLYAKEDVEPLLKTYANILAIFSRNPALKVEEPRMFAKADLDAATQIGQGTIMEAKWPSTLLGKIDDLCASRPNECALEGELSMLTYAQMSERVNGIVDALDIKNVSRETKVGVMQTPSPDLICSMLAVMRLGAVYVPLDPSWPATRLAAVMDSCKPTTVIADRTISQTHFSCFSELKRIDVEDTTPSAQVVSSQAEPESPCAILYTSGTTGAPKGLVLTHQCLSNCIEGTCINLSLRPQRVLQQSALTFDLSLDQIFVALCSGGSAYIVPQRKRRDAPEIAKIMAKQAITYTMGTPSEYAAWILAGSEYLKGAKAWTFLCAGGEPVPHSLLRGVKSLDLNCLRFVCIYGPAETTIASHRIEMNYRGSLPDKMPCGFAMPNYTAYIVDEDLKPVPVGWPGEILIGGPGVSQGYFNDPGLTATKYIPDSFASSELLRKGFTTLFRSGDRGRFRHDGALIIDGRVGGSTQVKLRGFRIDLRDIEASIIAAGGNAITTAIVSVRGEAEAQFLVAHVVFSPEQPSNGRKAFLHQVLGALSVPNYMRPALIFELDHMPLNHNAKIDRQAVGDLELPEVENRDEIASETLTDREAEMWALWREILPTDATATVVPAAETDFIGVGGNSILMVQVHARIKERLGITIPLFELFEVTTLRAMSAKCDAAVEGTPIDWEAETTLDITAIKLYAESRQSITPRRTNTGIRVLMTGATGFIGRRILETLVANSAVSEVHCIAVRQHPTYSFRPDFVATWANEGKDSAKNTTDSNLYFNSPKVTQYFGDLTRPMFGLCQEQFDSLSASVDVVIHSGANRAFWDSYHLVKAANVSSTRALIQLAAPRAVPITFISSGGVTSINSISDLSNEVTTGYVASKYVSEQLLKSAQRSFGFDVTVVRTLLSDNEGDYSAPDAKTITQTDLIRSMLQLDKKIGRRFVFDEFDGRISVANRLDLADRIAEAGLQLTSSHNERRLGYVKYNNTVDLTAKVWNDFIATNPAEIDEEWHSLPTMPALKWFGQSKIQDFEFIISGQEYDAGGKVSKR